MSFENYLTEDRRLVLLKALQATAQYQANGYLLKHFASSVGHTVSSDRIAQDLAWLREQGLVTLAEAGEVTVATLTTRGLDVATGATVVPGVKRPAPGE